MCSSEKKDEKWWSTLQFPALQHRCDETFPYITMCGCCSRTLEPCTRAVRVWCDPIFTSSISVPFCLLKATERNSFAVKFQLTCKTNSYINVKYSVILSVLLYPADGRKANYPKRRKLSHEAFFLWLLHFQLNFVALEKLHVVSQLLGVLEDGTSSLCFTITISVFPFHIWSS